LNAREPSGQSSGSERPRKSRCALSTCILLVMSGCRSLWCFFLSTVPIRSTCCCAFPRDRGLPLSQEPVDGVSLPLSREPLTLPLSAPLSYSLAGGATGHGLDSASLHASSRRACGGARSSSTRGRRDGWTGRPGRYSPSGSLQRQ